MQFFWMLLFLVFIGAVIVQWGIMMWNKDPSLFVLIIVGVVVSIIWIWYSLFIAVNKNLQIEEAERKKQIEEELKLKKEKDILVCHFQDAAKLIVENNIKIIAAAYRKSVTSNSFGKKNYTKFIPELIDFIESQQDIVMIKKELSEKYNSTITLSCDGNIINLVEEMIEALEKDSDYTDDIDPFGYEHYCASQFKKNGWKAEATQGSSDQGVDVIASKNGFTIVAQCKKYAKPVGNKAVQEIVAGKNHYKADKGIVIATNGFTNSAVRLAASNNIDLIHHTEIKDL